MGAKSATGSKGSEGSMAAFAACVWLLPSASVYPSGAACATAWVPTTAAPPGRLSTTKLLPAIASCRAAARLRANTSVDPPGG